jgi:hypothetical protein
LSGSVLPEDFEVGAVYLNEGDWAVAKVRFDEVSLDWILNNL